MQTSITDLLHTIVQKLQPIYGSYEAAEHNAWWLLEKLLQKDRTRLILETSLTLDKQQEQQLHDWLQQMSVHHMPIQYILGDVRFLNLTIAVKPPVIIPRPETEYWCSLLIQELKKYHLPRPFTILDLCSGSGCIALALAQAFPQAHVYAIDISKTALALAQQNSKRNNITNVVWLHGNLYEALPDNASFNLIVSNPPYIDPDDWASLDQEVTKWEDPHGLIAPDHGYAIIKKIIAEAPTYLKKDYPVPFPQLWIEIGAQQGDTCITMMKKAGFTTVHLIKDLAGKDRVITGAR